MYLLSLLVFVFSAFPVGFGLHVIRQSNSSVGLTGGSICVNLMCIYATASSSNVSYILQSKGSSSSLGWMAIGFGSSMANSPMVIMWPNKDGTVTLSQRMTSSHSMPTVDSNPPRVATFESSATNLSAFAPMMAFTIPKNSDTVQSLIWAYGTANPGSASVSAPIQQHVDFGTTTINLAAPLASSAGPTTSTSGSSFGNISIPLTKYERLTIAHGVLCVVGFLFLLPLGALVGRYLRTASRLWFKAHWIIQIFISGPIIIVGVALGMGTVTMAGATHLDDAHKRWGVVIFVLYFMQCGFGWVIHKFKPKSSALHRPFQNYGHAILGLTIIALGFYQVRTGYKTEWPQTTGRMPIGKAADVVWVVWIVLLPVLYMAGLALLPRQLKQEEKSRAEARASMKVWT